MKKPFKSVLQFQKYFDTDEKCREYLELQRWGGTPCCPFCGSVKNTRLKGGRRFQCNEKECRTKFSVTVGTVFENTKLPLSKWFLAIYILSNHSKGISSLQLSHWLDVTQSTAWFLTHRIRLMLTDKTDFLLRGIVETDESVLGGSLSNIHASKKKNMGPMDNKTVVFGAVERNGKVHTKIIPAATKENLTTAVFEKVEKGAILISDENPGYKDLAANYSHVTVNHSQGEYVRGAAYTNTIEGFWSMLKKQIKGIHHQVSPKHLQRYCNESAYRYNNKNLAQDERFADVLINCEGRLTYYDLTAN